MARTADQLTASEEVMIGELNGIANSKVAYKNSSGVWEGQNLPAGTGDVSKVGTPVNNQVGVWTGDGTLEGDTALTFDTTTDTLTSVTFAGNLTGNVTGNTSGSSGSCTGNSATATNVAVGGITGLGTGVATALAVNVGSAGAPVVNGGALGTPSSGTVTNLTGTASININGTVGATTPTTGKFTTVETTGNIELGHASDTTISRVSAGVIAVEGATVPTLTSTSTFATGLKTFLAGMFALRNVANTFNALFTNTNTADRTYTLQDSSDTLVGRATTDTLTNKRKQPRIISAASYTTDTGTSLDFSTCDEFIVTAQAGALLFNNPSGTPQHGEKIIIRIKDNGTARALTYDTQYRAVGVTLPTTTVISKTLYLGGIWNTTDTKIDIIAVGQEA